MKKKVLIAPLNWGLGHATRCIPIINALKESGCDVVIASDGPPYNLLCREFPRDEVVSLPPYDISYSATIPMAASIALQMPKILRNIRAERRFVATLHLKHRFDLVVSDCRFGCRIAGITNVYITHQVLIRFPAVLSPLEGVGAWLHRLVWEKFDRIWIVDRPGALALCGEMGHSITHPRLRYIGIASRFVSADCCSCREKRYDLCFLLSGPEPHRTILEKKIVNHPWPENLRFCLVRGVPGHRYPGTLPPNWTSFDHCGSRQLQEILCSSKKIVCRSGYSTIMDLARLGLRAVMIPTPGQPEQEYLACHLAEKMGFVWYSQDGIDLNRIASEGELARYEPYRETDDRALLQPAIEDVFRL